MTLLDTEEQELLDAFEAGALLPIADVAAELQRHKDYATATFQRDARINIRLSSKDLRLIKKRALSEGIPYQTLIASLIHKYLEGRLVEPS